MWVYASHKTTSTTFLVIQHCFNEAIHFPALDNSLFYRVLESQFLFSIRVYGLKKCCLHFNLCDIAELVRICGFVCSGRTPLSLPSARGNFS